MACCPASAGTSRAQYISCLPERGAKPDARAYQMAYSAITDFYVSSDGYLLSKHSWTPVWHSCLLRQMDGAFHCIALLGAFGRVIFESGASGNHPVGAGPGFGRNSCPSSAGYNFIYFTDIGRTTVGRGTEWLCHAGRRYCPAHPAYRAALRRSHS